MSKKQYNTSLLGLLSSIKDRITNNDEYKLEDGLRDLGGEPSLDFRSVEEKNKDYWHPIKGSRQRWIQSIDNGTNPLVGIKNTIIPALIGAGVSQAPSIISSIPKTVKSGYQAIRKDPSLIKNGLLDLGIALGKGLLGGRAVDNGFKTFTGQNFDEYIAPMLGVSKDVASFLNPGYLFGGVNTGLRKAFNKRNASIKELSRLRDEASRISEEEESVSNIYKSLGEALKQNRLKNKPVDDEYWKLFHAYRNSPYYTRLRRKQTIKNNSQKRSKYYQTGVPEIVQIDIPIANEAELASRNYPFDITFNGRTSRLNTNVSGELITDIEWRPDGVLERRVTLSSMPIVKGDTRELQEGVSSYIDNLSSIMGDDGVVAGSLVGYKNGIIKATKNGESFIGPADTEIYTTQSRLQGLKDKLQFKSRRQNAVGGEKGESPYTFRSDIHPGEDTEINIIGEDADGMATGKLAHQIYRSLYPERYSQMMYDYTMNPNNYGQYGVIKSPSQLSLPIKAEDLYQMLRSNPQSMQHHLLTDMLSMETFTNPKNIKGKMRQFNVIFSEDPTSQQMYNDALNSLGRMNLGSQFKLGTDLYPNLSFDNIDANIQFLKEVYGLSDNVAAQYASNPAIMRNAFNTYNYEMSTGTRMVGNDVVAQKVPSGEQYHNPKIEMFLGNGAFSGGQGLGPGLNQLRLSPFGGWHPGKSRNSWDMNIVAMSQRPLTYHPEKIKTPLDLVAQTRRLNRPANELYAGDLATFNLSKPIVYDTDRMRQIRDLAMEADQPVYLSNDYIGGLSEPISSGATIATAQDHPELGSLLMNINGRIHHTPSDNTYYINTANQKYKDIVSEFSRTPIEERLENLHKVYWQPQKENVKFVPLKRIIKSSPFSGIRDVNWSLKRYGERPDLLSQRKQLTDKLSIEGQAEKTVAKDTRRRMYELQQEKSKLNRRERILQNQKDRYLQKKPELQTKKDDNKYKQFRSSIEKSNSESNIIGILSKYISLPTLSFIPLLMSNQIRKNNRREIEGYIDNGLDLSDPYIRHLIQHRDDRDNRRKLWELKYEKKDNKTN